MATAYPGMEEKGLEEDEIETGKYQLPAPLRNLNSEQERYLQKKQEEHEEEQYRIQNRESQIERDYKTYPESKKVTPELIKETKGRDKEENSKEGYDVMLDKFYLGDKPQAPRILDMKKVNKWKELANTLTVEEMELMQAEMYEGLELAKKESIKTRGRLATRPKAPLNTIRKDRERVNKYSPISDREEYRFRTTKGKDYTEDSQTSDWMDEYYVRKNQRKMKTKIESPKMSTPQKRENTYVSPNIPSPPAYRKINRPNLSSGRSPTTSRTGSNNNIPTDGLAYSLANAMKTVGIGDSYTVPEPEPFKIGTGQKMHKFFNSFEKYCENKYSRDQDDWIKVLGKYLQGEIKSVYEAVKISKEDYLSLKSKLLEWYQMTRVRTDTGFRAQFEHAQMKPGESIGIYAVRLEALAEKAYPEVSIERNRDLRKKFIKTVPDYFVKKLFAHNTVIKRCTGRDLPWSDVVQLATLGEDYTQEIETAYETYYNDNISLENHRQPKIIYKVNSQLTNNENTNIANNNRSNFMFRESKENKINTYRRNFDQTDYNNNNNNNGNKYNNRGKNINNINGTRRYSRNVSNTRDNNYVNNSSNNGPRNCKFNQNTNKHQSTNSQMSRCNYCNKVGHNENNCRIKLGLCLKCGGMNHFAKHCHLNTRQSFNNYNSHNHYSNMTNDNNLSEKGIQTIPNTNDVRWETENINPTPEGGLTPLNMNASA